MNIQQFIDRKRIAGAREHEGNKTDWAGWTRERYISAAASELLDACAYVQRAMEVAQKTQDAELFHTALFIADGAKKLLNGLDESDLEAACQEAEQRPRMDNLERIKELEAENKELFYRAAVALDLEKDNAVLCNFCIYEHFEDDPPCDECRQGKSFKQRIGTLGLNELPCGTCYQGDKFKQRLVDFNAKIAELEAELAEAKRRAAWYLAYCDKCEFCFYAIYETDADRCESCHDSEIGEYKNFVLAPVPDDFEVKENG